MLIHFDYNYENFSQTSEENVIELKYSVLLYI